MDKSTPPDPLTRRSIDCTWAHQCHRSYVKLSDLYNHVFEVHIRKVVSEFVCEWQPCASTKQKFESKSGLLDHMYSHFKKFSPLDHDENDPYGSIDQPYQLEPINEDKNAEHFCGPTKKQQKDPKNKNNEPGESMSPKIKLNDSIEQLESQLNHVSNVESSAEQNVQFSQSSISAYASIISQQTLDKIMEVLISIQRINQQKSIENNYDNSKPNASVVREVDHEIEVIHNESNDFFCSNRTRKTSDADIELLVPNRPKETRSTRDYLFKQPESLDLVDQTNPTKQIDTFDPAFDALVPTSSTKTPSSNDANLTISSDTQLLDSIIKPDTSPNLDVVFTDLLSTPNQPKNELIFKCDLCEWPISFNHESSLIRHTQTMHSQNRIACIEFNCDKEFVQKRDLMRHYQRQHSIECDYENCFQKCTQYSKLVEHWIEVHELNPSIRVNQVLNQQNGKKTESSSDQTSNIGEERGDSTNSIESTELPNSCSKESLESETVELDQNNPQKRIKLNHKRTTRSTPT